MDGELRDRARRLRWEPTEAERALWGVLRGRGLDGHRFRRQHPVPPYILDFACVASRLAVEIDGGQHARSDRDRERDAYLEARGWRVLRFWNNEVLGNLEGVAERIAEVLKEPPPRPSPAVGEGGGRAADSLPGAAGEGRGGGGALPRARAIASSGVPFASVTLAHDDRHRRRLRLVTDGGLAFLLDLPEARALRHGDLLRLDDGRLVEVRAAPEEVLEVRGRDAAELARLAWHLGNRHAPTQVLPGALRLRADHVLEHLLRDHLGAEVVRARAPFDPEGGAYHHHDHEH